MSQEPDNKPLQPANEGANVDFHLTSSGVDVFNKLREKFGLETLEETVMTALVEGAAVMVTRPDDYYKLPLGDPSRETSWSDFELDIDTERIIVQ